MSKLKPPFSTNPLKLSCCCDPRESYYNAGFVDFGTQWSVDYDSTIQALKNFIDGAKTYTDVPYPVRPLLKENPLVMVKYDQRSYDSLLRTAKAEMKSPEEILQSVLKVKKFEIQRY